MTCSIEYIGKQRNGAPRYWCSEHRQAATPPKYTACSNAGAPPPAPRVLDIDPSTFPGGIALWGALPPIINTANLPVETGVHVHARTQPGHEKAIDDTFDIVHLRTRDTTTAITGPAAASYNIGVILGREPIDLSCPRCHEPHTDEDWFAVNPHRKHLCLRCGHDFIANQKSIGNPIITAKRILDDPAFQRPIVTPRRRLAIQTTDYPGGIQVWGTHPAILWTAAKHEETGIHVHAFDADGTVAIDETFATVTLNGRVLDPQLVRVLMAQRALPHLQTRLVSLTCPRCKQPHHDENVNAFTPHRTHVCETCTEHFHAPGRNKHTVSNPLIGVLQELQPDPSPRRETGS